MCYELRDFPIKQPRHRVRYAELFPLCLYGHGRGAATDKYYYTFDAVQTKRSILYGALEPRTARRVSVGGSYVL